MFELAWRRRFLLVGLGGGTGSDCQCSPWDGGGHGLIWLLEETRWEWEWTWEWTWDLQMVVVIVGVNLILIVVVVVLVVMLSIPRDVAGEGGVL